MKYCYRRLLILMFSFIAVFLYSLPIRSAEVDLLVTYDDYSRRYFNGDVETAMLNWVSQMNDVYQASQVDIQLRLVGVRQYDYSASQMNQVLDHISNSSTLNNWRNELGADYVSQLHYTGRCGIGWVAVNSRYAWNVVGPGCGAIVMAHELGHNMGLTHSRRQGDRGGSRYSYALGYGVDNLFSTVMAYESAFNARRIGVFSHPGLNCRGVPCGVPAGQSQQADAHLALNNVADEVADFRTPVVIPDPKSEITKPTPGSVLTSSTVTFEWSDVDGATAYDLLLGTTGPGSTEIRSSSVLTNTNSLTLDNLPITGERIYARLWTYSGNWQYNDYSFETRKINDLVISEMRAEHSGYCADVADGSSSNGAGVVQNQCDSTDRQAWEFEAVSGREDVYFIRSTASDKCLDVTGASLANGARVIQWSCHGGTNQQWQLRPVESLGNDYFNLVSVRSGKCLDVASASYNQGGRVIQWTCHQGGNQIWYIPGQD